MELTHRESERIFSAITVSSPEYSAMLAITLEMTVYKLEKELLSFKSDLNTTKKLIRQAEDSIDDFSDGWEGLVDDFVDESTLYSAWPIQIPTLDPRGEDMCLGFSCGGSAVLYDAGGSTYCRSW